MSRSRALVCLPSVNKKENDFHFFFTFSVIIQQLLDSVLVISKVSVRVILIPTLALIILDITEISSDNIV